MNGSPDLFTIGHSNLPADRFVGLLKSHGVTLVADVRSVPLSRRFPWFSARTLAERLQGQGIAYVGMGETLGGRPADLALYRDGVADYEAMAKTAGFREGLERISSDMRRHRLCLMCSECEPLDCHRCLLIGRALAAHGTSVGHILGDGSVEPQAATEQRLLRGRGENGDLFADRSDRLADAYRKHAGTVAARLSDRVRPGRVPRALTL